MSTTRPKNPRFEVYPTSVGVDELEWRWRLFARNGEIIASGEGYTREKDAKRGVQAVIRAVLTIVGDIDGATIIPGTIERIVRHALGRSAA